MKKSHFISLIFCIMAGLAFSIGLCMCLLPEWNAFVPGVVLTAIGGIALIVYGIISYARVAKNKAPINWQLVGNIAFGVVATLILGLGMAMIMVWNLMLWGIIVGVIGLFMLLCLIPMFLGFKK
ncbi:MAG: hypothetical protein IKB21_02405 [Clostridia bacterium]|nr:hypothetical protein [Clostridia bacterium]